MACSTLELYWLPYKFVTIKPMNKLSKKSILMMFATLILLIIATVGFLVWKNKDPKPQNVQNDQTTVQADSNKADTVQQATTETEKQPTGTIITSGNSEFGTMLFDDKGQAIYIWELEESSKAECYDDCAEAWPPVLTDGTPKATGEVNGKLLNTTKRNDGTTQVTYNGHPLYYYAHEKPGEVKCHNIRTHGGLWWVIQPNGIRAK